MIMLSYPIQAGWRNTWQSVVSYTRRMVDRWSYPMAYAFM